MSVDSGCMQMMFWGRTLVLALGDRSGITIWLEIWRKTRNLKVMWFTAQQTAHKRYTKVQFSSSTFQSCMTFAVNLFLNNRPHWSCSSRNGAGLWISMAQGTEGKWDSTGHWCVLEYSPIYHKPTLACVWKKEKKGGSNHGCFGRFPWLNCSWKTSTHIKPNSN